MHVGADYVKVAHTQRLLQEFANISFKDVELVDDFPLHINALSEDLRGLEESITDSRVVNKMLCVLPKPYSQIAVSIEMLLDLNTFTMEDLVEWAEGC